MKYSARSTLSTYERSVKEWAIDKVEKANSKAGIKRGRLWETVVDSDCPADEELDSDDEAQHPGLNTNVAQRKFI